MTMLIPVGIIGFSYGERHREPINELCKFVGDANSFKVIIDILGDRSTVLSQPKFADAVAFCFEELIDKLLEISRAVQGVPDVPSGCFGVVVAVVCGSGQYLSDVFPRVLAEWLNSVQFDGERVFNACDFSLNGCKSYFEIRTEVRQVGQWAYWPWNEQKSVSKEDDSWCVGVVGKDSSAREVVEDIWSFAALKFQENHEKALINILKVFDPDRFDAIIDKGRKKQEPPRHQGRCREKRGKCRKKKEQTPASSSKAEPAPIGAARIGRARGYVEKEQEEQEEQPWKKSRGSISNEAWQSFEWDARKWSSVLDDKGMDQQSQMQFFLLAQSGESGKYEASKLLSKMIDPVFWEDNPSVWLYCNVMRARFKIGIDAG